ncbi:hypothetical protein ACHQM5_024693 [Ranunculus cassubicifolius]
MDRRGWPWKKKSSDKAGEKSASAADSAGATLPSAGSQGDQEKPKKPNYVKISEESYAHLTGLEDEVKSLNDQVKTLNDEVDVLNEKLSSAHSEMTTKENIVKQHAKVAEEAVSGWEKADAEALALKQQLEAVTLLKLTAEDRAAHLDGALKECMKQIRSLKEEHEKKLHETILTKNKQFDKIKLEFEAKMNDLDQELLRSSAENSALSRALQERSNMLMKANEERSHAEAEIELLKNDIQSCEKEINSLKYELHLLSTELDIRNEEKNMSMKSAEVANRQHLEGVKKITKLEAECQRLRGLVRKKLPGPAALAQMKLEVESLGRDYGETRPRRSPSQNPSPHLAPQPDISLESVQQCHKENEFLMGRCLAMEEEMKMLKEALAKRNSELQVSRNMCAKTSSKLRSLEAQVNLSIQQRGSPRLSIEMPAEGFSSQNGSNPPSYMSMSEDGIDEEGSCVESWATVSVGEISQLKKGRSIDKPVKAENMNQLELMDDFLEMERLACSTDSKEPVPISKSSSDVKTENEDDQYVVKIAKDGDLSSVQQPELSSSPKVESLGVKTESDIHDVSLSKLHSRISAIFESESKDADTRTILEDIKGVMRDMEDTLLQHSPNHLAEKTHSVGAISNDTATQHDREGEQNGISLILVDQEFTTAIYQIHDFVVSLSKEAMQIQEISFDEQDIIKESAEFSNSVSKVLSNEMSLVDFVLSLSHALAKINKQSINLLCSKANGEDNNSSDYIDKVTLLEKKVVQDDVRERFPNGCTHISRCTSDPEVLVEGSLSPGVDLKFTPCKCSLEELEQLKSEKENMELELSRCSQHLGETKTQLQETENLLTELKLQLAASQKSNSLAETQLKCMAESYNTLETHTQELDTQVNLLREKMEALDVQLEEEKQKNESASTKCRDLEEQLQRNESCPTCASSIAEAELKSQKEREIAAATEKLAECQETILLLGKQLNSLRPSESPHSERGSPYHEKQTAGGMLEEKSPPRRLNRQGMYYEMDDYESDMEVAVMSPSDIADAQLMRSPVSSKRAKHRPTKSSSSSSSTPTPEKEKSRGSGGISRFFSSKSSK